MRPLHFGRLVALCAALVVSASLGAAYVQAGRQASAPAQMVISHAGKLLLTDGTGVNARTLLPGAGRYTYPWYAWSPDGKYLLVVRVAAPPANSWNLLILDAQGTLVRRVGDAQPGAGFYPNWAIDGDRVAYLSRRSAAPGKSTVRWMGPRGRSGALFSFVQQAGCGGGGADPADMVYLQQTADGGMTFPLQWSIKQHSALMWIGAGTSLIDTRTGVARHLGTARQQMGDAVLSRTGQLAAALQVCGKAGCAGRIVLVDPVTLRATHDLGRGELPAWSADGQSLYFVRRTLTSVLRFKDASGNPTPSNVYRTSIWRAGADASGLTRLVDEDAYGFGFLNVSSDGGTLVFSRVDNATQLWQHRLTNDAFNSTLLKRYGPQVTVQRYSGDGSPTTLFRDGGLPSVQP